MEEHFRMSKRFFQLPTDRKMETILDENAKYAALIGFIIVRNGSSVTASCPANSRATCQMR